MKSNYLEEFYESMVVSNLSAATINKHYDNIHFFATSFLEPYIGVELEDGIEYVNEFLGDWFLRKAMWSTEASLKQNITSLKKFYQFLSTMGYIDESKYKTLLAIIKSEKANWIASVNEYNNVTEFESKMLSFKKLFLNETENYEDMLRTPNQDYDDLLDKLLIEKPWLVLGHLFPVRVTTNNSEYFVQCTEEGDEISISVYLGNTLVNSMTKIQSLELADSMSYSAYLESYNIILDIDHSNDIIVTTYKQDKLNASRELEHEELDEMFKALTLYVELLGKIKYHLDVNNPGEFYCYSNALIKTSSFAELHHEMVEKNKSILRSIDLEEASKIEVTKEKWFISKKAVDINDEWSWLYKINVDMKTDLTCYTNADEEIDKVKDFILGTVLNRGKPCEVVVEYEVGKSIEERIIEELLIPLQVENQPTFPVYGNKELIAVDMTINSKPVTSLKKALNKLNDEQLEFMSLVVNGDFESRVKAIEEIRSAYTSEFTLFELATLNDMEYSFMIDHMQTQSFDSNSKLEEYANLVDKGYLLEFYYKNNYSYVIPDEIKVSYTLINKRELEVVRYNYWLIADFINACVHFYGLISIDRLCQMALENIDIDENDFEAYLNILLIQSHDIESDESFLIDSRIMAEQHYLSKLKTDTSYYMPGITELLKYKDFNYSEETIQEKVMKNFLRMSLNLDEEALNYLVIHLRLIADFFEEHERLSHINALNLEFESDNQYAEFMTKFADFLNTRRLKINHGYTNNELSHHSIRKIGRNDPCPCGSRKKFKKCCGKN